MSSKFLMRLFFSLPISPLEKCVTSGKARRFGINKEDIYSSLSSREAPFRSATTSEAAAFMGSTSLATDSPSPTEAVGFVSPCPLVAAVVGVLGTEDDSSASRRSTSSFAFAIFFKMAVSNVSQGCVLGSGG